MAPSKSPSPVDALIVNIPQELEPKGPSGTVIIPKSQSKNKKAAASGEASSKAWFCNQIHRINTQDHPLGIELRMMVKKHEQNMHGKTYEWSWIVKVRMNPPRPPSKTILTVIFQFEASWLSKITAKEFMALRTNSKAVVIQVAPGLWQGYNFDSFNDFTLFR